MDLKTTYLILVGKGFYIKKLTGKGDFVLTENRDEAKPYSHARAKTWLKVCQRATGKECFIVIS